MHFAVVCCGAEVAKNLTALLKSLVIFSSHIDDVMLHIFIDGKTVLPHLYYIDAVLRDSGTGSSKSLSYAIYQAQFPKDGATQWYEEYKPCSTMRLFLPYLLRHVTKVIYLDLDIIVLRPLADLWRHFDTFDDKQIAGLTPARLWFNMTYDLTSDKPFSIPYGFNAGVQLMRLDRMRQLPWECIITHISFVHRDIRPFGDQDTINIFFYMHPTLVYVLPCSFNYRIDVIKNTHLRCADALTNGVAILHGIRCEFHTDVEPVLRHIYDVFLRTATDDSSRTTLLRNLDLALDALVGNHALPDIYTTGLRRLVRPL